MTSQRIGSWYDPRVRLSIDLTDEQGVPYFLWDEPIPLAELRSRLQSPDDEERARWAGKVMREARFDESMALIPLARLLADYDRIRRHLGRRRRFWDYLLGEWRALGLVH